MGADIKSLRTRIASVDSTLHLTQAMGLVASSKIRRATVAMTNSKQYLAAISELSDLLLSSASLRSSPYLNEGTEGKILYIVIAGDRSMAGGYNNNIFRALAEVRNDECDIYTIGTKAAEKLGGRVMQCEKFSTTDAAELANKICDDYNSKKYRKVIILSTKYNSALSQVPEFTQILPLCRKGEPDSSAAGLIFEPNEEEILKSALPAILSAEIYRAVCEGFCCEVYSRRNAMDSATKNAQEMLDSLHISYNRARQGAITQEITEIVAGAGS